jgi:Flp pilus assembly protein TadD
VLKLAAASSATGNDVQARDAYSQALELQPMNGVLLYKR